MARTTVVTHPDGSTTTIVTRSGCGVGCGWILWIVLGLSVILYPAQAFPLWGAILAYTGMVVIAVAAVAVEVARRRDSGAVQPTQPPEHRP